MTKAWILVATEGQSPDRDDRNVRAYAHEPDAQAALDRLTEWISERRDVLRRRRYDDGPAASPPDDDPRFRTNGMDAHTVEWWIDVLDLVEASEGEEQVR